VPTARGLHPAAGGVLRGAPRRRAARGHGLSASPAERRIAVDGCYDFDESLRFLPFGPFDPTCRRARGVLWKAARTPEGPVTLHLRRTQDVVLARAWGEGAEWALARAGALLGLEDDWAAFVPPAGPLAALARRWRGLRLSRSPWVLDGLCEYVLQQRVSTRDAMRSQRRLVQALSAPAPGPPGLRLPLGPADWRGLDAAALYRAGIDGQRARALRAAASNARRIENAFRSDRAAARAILSSIPGCGAWTVEITLGFVLGDSDAVPTGDLHLPHEVAWALAGEPRADDRRMLELLEPFRGQRFRLLRLLLAGGRLRLGRALPRSRG
jgi:3-methyladenine DNA glycosylase/8-oxoguanine DNA glycosylase